MMEKKRPVGVAVLGGVFFGVALLPMWILLFKLYPYLSGESFFISIVPAVIFYLACGLIVFNRWFKLRSWQKGALIGIGIQSILLYSWMLIQIALLQKALSGFVMWLVLRADIILCPFVELYRKFVIYPRAILRNGVYVSSTYFWETGILFPLFRIVYAGTVGAIIGKLIEKGESTLPAPK